MDSSETLSRAIENPNLKQSVRFGIVLEAGGQDGALLFRQDSSAAVGAALPRSPAPAPGGRGRGCRTGRLLPPHPAHNPFSVLPSLLS